jgi:hypothetical protein
MAAIERHDDWLQVPARVGALLPTARQLKQAHIKAAESVGFLSHAIATWHPERAEVSVFTPFHVPDFTREAYANMFVKHASARLVFVEQDNKKPDLADEVLIKCGALHPMVGKLWDGAHTALGGARPLSNAIVSGLALGGLGYGVGTLAENLFPERYMQRGKLRKSLALAGGLGGLGIGAANAYANSQATNTSWLNGWLVPNNAKPHGIPIEAQTNWHDGNGPDVSKMAAMQSGLMAPSIPVDAFNRVVWNDVRPTSYANNPYGTKSPWGDNSQQMHTPPQLAAATTGLMSGIGAMAQSPIISPGTVINGLMSAGVGLATANIAGRTLGALAGLTPEAQNKIQDLGLWAGVLHAVVPPVLRQLR